MKFLFIFLFLRVVSSDISLERNEQLIQAVAGFCTSSDGYDSGFCVDYAKLRRGELIFFFETDIWTDRQTDR